MIVTPSQSDGTAKATAQSPSSCFIEARGDGDDLIDVHGAGIVRLGPVDDDAVFLFSTTRRYRSGSFCSRGRQAGFPSRPSARSSG